jgi:hypothetical protein
VSRYPAPAPVDDFVLLFLPPCGPHLTPLATESLESGLLVSPLLGGPARHRPFVPTLHLHQHPSSRNLHLQYSAKSQSTPRCQSLITARSDHPPVLGRSGPQPDAAMARFRSGLNCEIRDIFDYKEYADMTQLFEFACKAEREVQGRRSRTYSNTFAGRNSSSSSAPALPAPSTPTPCERTATSVGAAPATCTTPSTGAAYTTGLTRDITCFRCSERGHVARECPN